MDGDEDSSSEHSKLKKNIIILFITAYLGYTITDTYFILWLANIFGEESVSISNSIGAIVAVFLGIGVMKLLRGVDDVNKKVLVGSLIYSMLEIMLYFILSGIHEFTFLVMVFIIDNVALITYSAPIETLAIKLLGKDKSVEVGTISTRSYIMAGIVGAGIAYSLYPDFTYILAAAVIFKVTTGIMAMKLPYVENHDSINLSDVIDTDLLRNLPMAISSEVYYLTAPVIVSAITGNKMYALYVIFMELVVFITLPYFTRMRSLSRVGVGLAVLIPIVPVIGLLPYYSVMNAMMLRSRAEIMDEWGVDDSVTGVNVQKVLAAVLAVPFIKVFGVSVWLLSALMFASTLIFHYRGLLKAREMRKGLLGVARG